MILWFENLAELNFEELMAVYEEGNKRNGSFRYPMESEATQKFLAERDFEDYLRTVFFRQKDAAYCVLAEDDTYLSAARIEPYKNGYLLSALETRPAYRRRGYGRHLVNALLQECDLHGIAPVFSHVANQNIPSLKLHLQCGFSVFSEFARYLDGSVRTDCKTLIYKK